MNDGDEEVSVDADGVSLRKTLNDHQFETLAVVFDIRSARERPARVTIRDAIPDGVAAEDIGFHPEYGGDNWRAEGDEIVFSRSFAPGEQYTTVYGVRDFEEPRSALLENPTVAVDAGAVEGAVDSIDDLVDEGDSDMVREVIAGERDSLPGMGEGAEAADAQPRGEDLVETGAEGTDWGDEAADPLADEATGGEAAEADVAEEDDGWGDEDDGWGDEDESGGDDGAADTPTSEEPAAEPTPEAAGSEVTEATEDVPEEPEDAPTTEPDAAEEAEDSITVSTTGGVARVLAKELRAGNVDAEDRRLLREELLPDEGSTDARIKRLQTQVADLAAYTDALETFLDEEGGAEAILEDVEADLDEVAEDVAAVEGSVEELGDTVGELATDVESVEDEVATVGEELRTVGETTDRLDEEVAALESSVGAIDDLDRRLGHLEDDVDAIQDQLEELASFRDRLSSVFGADGMGGGSMGDVEPEDDEYEDNEY